MVNRRHTQISLSRECKLLSVSRSSVYYQPRKVKQEDLDLMRLIDEQYLKTPAYGSRSMRTHLQRLGYKISRKRVQRLMRKMGLRAIYPKPKTSIRHPEHKIYPYLLRNLKIKQPNQVWCADITYLPISTGFMYLVAVMDWHSRKVLSWRISNTLEAGFCVDALEDAVSRYGCPGIFNTDQGSQFTSEAFTDALKGKGIKISMDGRGCFLDNIFIERLWWTLKYHYLYLHSFDTGRALKSGLKSWFAYYNHERGHQALGGWTPDEMYYRDLPWAAAA